VLPTARTGEALAAIGGCPIADGTLLQCRDLAAERLAPTVERIAELIVASRVQHGEEIGTRFLTQSAWHASRSREAMDEIGMGPRFPGRGMHDRLASAETSACAHRIGGAHLVRECAAVARQEHPQGATAMHDACQQWRPLHLTSIPTIERDDWTRARSCELLAAGSAAHLPAPASSTRSRKGRPRQRQATNRLDALLGCADHMLALLDDLRIPLTNSRASRDLRWATVRHTMSGTSRRAAGATALCRIRSSLATMHKPGHSMLSALPAVFHAHSFLVAWESE
jgi:transposase